MSMSFGIWLHECAFRSISEVPKLKLAEGQGCWIKYAPLFSVDQWATTRSIIGRRAD
jgi:hypothetical protein